MIIRVLSFIVVFLCALFFPFWVFLPAAVVYGFVYAPYELMLIGVLIDVQFGDVGTSTGYLYTAVTAVSAIMVVLAKPHLRFRQ